MWSGASSITRCFWYSECLFASSRNGASSALSWLLVICVFSYLVVARLALLLWSPSHARKPPRCGAARRAVCRRGWLPHIPKSRASRVLSASVRLLRVRTLAIRHSLERCRPCIGGLAGLHPASICPIIKRNGCSPARPYAAGGASLFRQRSAGAPYRPRRGQRGALPAALALDILLPGAQPADRLVDVEQPAAIDLEERQSILTVPVKGALRYAERLREHISGTRLCNSLARSVVTSIGALIGAVSVSARTAVEISAGGISPPSFPGGSDQMTGFQPGATVESKVFRRGKFEARSTVLSKAWNARSDQAFSAAEGGRPPYFTALDTHLSNAVAAMSSVQPSKWSMHAATVSFFNSLYQRP